MPRPSPLVSKGHLKSSAPRQEMQRFSPGERFSTIFHHYWLSRWSLPEGETRPQRTLPYPGGNVVIEPETCRIFGASSRVFEVTLSGVGFVFGALLKPSGAASLAGLRAGELLDTFTEFEGGFELSKLRELLAEGDFAGAVSVFESGWSPPTPSARAALADRVVALIADDGEITQVADVVERLGSDGDGGAQHLSIRGLQRLLEEQVGLGAKWLIRRRRLQEAANALEDGHADLAAIASDLGYTDQAHFSREFKEILGYSPGQYQGLSS